MFRVAGVCGGDYGFDANSLVSGMGAWLDLKRLKGRGDRESR